MINVRAFVFTVSALVLLVACSTAPPQFSANESCDLPPNVWYPIPSPAEREFLLGLPEQRTGQPVREHFVTSGAQREAWLQDSRGNLQACIYNPSKRSSCDSDELITIIFTKTERSWVAGPTLQHFCIS
jgi:hypothetical protein